MDEMAYVGFGGVLIGSCCMSKLPPSCVTVYVLGPSAMGFLECITVNVLGPSALGLLESL